MKSTNSYEGTSTNGDDRINNEVIPVRKSEKVTFKKAIKSVIVEKKVVDALHHAAGTAKALATIKNDYKVHIERWDDISKELAEIDKRDSAYNMARSQLIEYVKENKDSSLTIKIPDEKKGTIEGKVKVEYIPNTDSDCQFRITFVGDNAQAEFKSFKEILDDKEINYKAFDNRNSEFNPVSTPTREFLDFFEGVNLDFTRNIDLTFSGAAYVLGLNEEHGNTSCYDILKNTEDYLKELFGDNFMVIKLDDKTLVKKENDIQGEQQTWLMNGNDHKLTINGLVNLYNAYRVGMIKCSKPLSNPFKYPVFSTKQEKLASDSRQDSSLMGLLSQTKSIADSIINTETPNTIHYIANSVESSIPTNPLLGDGWDDLASALIASGGLKAAGDYITIACTVLLAPQTFNGARQANEDVIEKLSDYKESNEKKKDIINFLVMFEKLDLLSKEKFDFKKASVESIKEADELQERLNNIKLDALKIIRDNGEDFEKIYEEMKELEPHFRAIEKEYKALPEVEYPKDVKTALENAKKYLTSKDINKISVEECDAFLQGYAELKEESKNSWIKYLDTYITSPVFSFGMSTGMFGAMMAAGASGVMGLAGQEAAKKVLENITDVAVPIGIAATIPYSILNAMDELSEYTNLEKQIKEIGESKILSEEDKKLAIAYTKDLLPNQRVQANMSFLIAGAQAILGVSPATGPLKPLFAGIGGGLTIGSVITKIISEMRVNSRLGFDNELSADEKKILALDGIDEKAKNELEGIKHKKLENLTTVEKEKVGTFLDRLQMKVDKLGELRKEKVPDHIWDVIYQKIRLASINHPGVDEKNIDMMLKKVNEEVLKVFSFGTFEDVKNKANEIFQDKEKEGEIKKLIEMFLNDRTRFYRHQINRKKSVDESIKSKKDSDNITKNGFVVDPELFMDLIKIKSMETVIRKLMYRLVMENKSADNIRGAKYSEYIGTSKAREAKSVSSLAYIPYQTNIRLWLEENLPTSNFAKFMSGLLTVDFEVPGNGKEKTIYTFKMEEYFNDMIELLRGKLDSRKQEKVKEIWDEIFTEREGATLENKIRSGFRSPIGHNVCEKLTRGSRSDVLRPTDIQRSIVEKEHIFTKAFDKTNLRSLLDPSSSSQSGRLLEM